LDFFDSRKVEWFNSFLTFFTSE